MAAKKTKKPQDVLSEIFHRTVEIMGDLTAATATASMNASLTSAKHLVKFQKSSTQAGLKLVGKVQDYTEKSLRDAMKDGKWLPGEGKDVVDEWAKMMDSGLDEFSRVVEKSFDLVLKYLDRVEKEAKAKESKSKTGATKRASQKRAPKKSAARKTSAKKTSKRKAASKKKTPSAGTSK